MKVIKHSVVNEDIENLMKDNNPELNPDKYEDAVTALSPAYAQALKTEKNIKSRLGKNLKDMSKQSKEVTPPTPSTGKKVKTAYTAKEGDAEELDESLFEDAEELCEVTRDEMDKRIRDRWANVRKRTGRDRVTFNDMTADERRSAREDNAIDMINSILAYIDEGEMGRTGVTLENSAEEILDAELSRKYSYLKNYVNELGRDRIIELIQGQLDDIDRVEHATGVDSDGISYNSIKWKNKGVAEAKKKKASTERTSKESTGKISFNEELGPYANEPYMDSIAYDLRRGDYYGDVDNVPWSMTINGRDCEDFESTWLLEYLLEDISYAVRDGHLEYMGFETTIYKEYLEDISPSDKSLVFDDLQDIFDLSEKDIEDMDDIDFHYDWDISFDTDEWESVAMSSDEDLTEAKKKVEGMPDTVYELVYDRLFPGGVKAAKTLILKDNPISFDDSRYYSKGLGLYDIGVAVMNQEEADFVKSLADYLKLDYKFRNAKLKDNAIGVACILMDDDVGDKDTSEYLAEIGIKKPVRVKFSKKDLGEGKITRYYDVYTFEPSASASDAFDKIIEQGKLDALDAFIDNEYDGEIEDAKLDELLRWEPEYIFDAIGVEY